MSQSILTKDGLKNAKIGKNEAIIGQLGIVAKKKGKSSITAQFLGIKKDQFIYQDLDIIAVKKAKNGNHITVDSSFIDQGHKLEEQISQNGTKKKNKIVGFVNNAKINIAPIVYGSMKTWKKLRMVAPNVDASAVVSKHSNYKFNYKDA